MRERKRRKVRTAMLLVAAVLVAGCLLGYSAQADSYRPDEAYKQSLRQQGFPESYLTSLDQLHQKHPNWVFQPMLTGIEWQTLIDNEDMGTKSLISNNSISSWKSLEDGAYNWETSQWTVYDGTDWVRASRALVEYYADPRTQLDEKAVFQFLSSTYQPESQTKEGLQNVLRGTFMASSDKLVDGQYTYADAIMEAAGYSKVSPYAIGSKIRLEQGVTGNTGLISGTYPGYEGYYNYFNHGAYNEGSMSNVERGLRYAKGLYPNGTSKEMLLPWNTRMKAIKGGAYKYGEYTRRGQDTNYLEKFNVVWKGGSGLFYGQYFTHIRGANSLGIALSAAYEGVNDTQLVFKIPVYQNMPENPCPMPTGDGSPNYKLKTLSVNGYSLTPAFSTDTLNYSLVVEENVGQVTVNAEAYDSKNAKIAGTGTVSLKHGQNQIPVTVTAGNGTKRTYTLSITRKGVAKDPEYQVPSGAEVDSGSGYLQGISPGMTAEQFVSGMKVKNGTAVVTKADGSVNTGRLGTGDTVTVKDESGRAVFQHQVVIYGDVNGDGRITSVDMLLGQRHILGLAGQSGAFLEAIDANHDGRARSVDLLLMQRQALGLGTIAQK